ncbi:YecR family lipoprotein [Stenotrophomonas sp.]|uniref:YecR family lipoprotein n=1 Tax=Stenotrophomonas sp. TaxID=69392 RepID=UPI00289BD6CD|nr:YecR family lipoprotein [Stenotrophomonas sp.]
MKTKAIVVMAALLLLGTAQARSSAEWNLKGASRAEGKVVLTLVSKQPELTADNRQAAEQTATRQCAAWGQSAAELNGDIERICDGRSRFGKCKRWRFTMPLQCSAVSH